MLGEPCDLVLVNEMSLEFNMWSFPESCYSPNLIEISRLNFPPCSSSFLTGTQTPCLEKQAPS